MLIRKQIHSFKIEPIKVQKLLVDLMRESRGFKGILEFEI